MRSFLVVFAAIALVALASAEQVSYRNYKVYKIDVANRDQLELLGRWREVDGVDFWDNAGRRIMIQPALQEKFEAFLNVNKIANELIIPDVEAYKVYKIDVANRGQHELLGQWREVDGVDFWDNAGRRIMIHPALQEKFEAFLTVNQIANELIIPDVEATIEAERQYDLQYRRTKGATSDRATVDFDHFWSTEEIYQYLDGLAAAFPNLVKVETVGQTHEGRDIKSVTISTTNGQVSGTKPVIFIDAGVHAREWAAIMSTVYLIHELVEHNDLYADMLQKDWVIIPIGNPDGYEFSRTNNRMWRKNRVPASILCTGVDINRNFNYRWASGIITCSESFPGPNPESELETQAIVGLMKRYAGNLDLYLAVHTFGDMILYPFGYTLPFVPVANAAEHIAMGERARAAVLAVGGPDYIVGNSAEILYTANGVSDDYAVGEAGFKY